MKKEEKNERSPVHPCGSVIKMWTLLSLFWLGLYGTVSAQTSEVREFGYDAAGNRVLRSVPSSSGVAPRSAQADVSEDTALPGQGISGGFTLSASPNPTTGNVAVVIQGEGDFTEAILSLHSPDGRLLAETPLSGSSATVDLSPYPAGVYVLAVRWGAHSKELKIVKL